MVNIAKTMSPKFSERTEFIMESYIMELIEVAKRPGMISFATGLPDKKLFNVEAINKAAAHVLESEDATDSLQYGVTAGLPALREKIAARCNRDLGLKITADNVYMTNGSQECFDLMSKLFLDKGDGIAVENPGYLGALQSFSVYGPEFTGFTLLNDGPDMDSFRNAIRKSPKLCYMIPNHQNPSGVSYSEEKRKEAAEILNGSDTLLLEDDAYGELGYEGREYRSISSYTDNTVLTGSFSKVISPGMRVGWMVIPDWLKEKASSFLEAGCLHAGSFSQRVLNRFLEENDYDAYLRPIRQEYRRKKDLFLDLMEENLPDKMSWNNPTGGMFVMLRAPEGTDAMKIYKHAMEHGLVIMPCEPFHVNGGKNTLRLNFATASDEEMKKGMKILGDACRSVL